MKIIILDFGTTTVHVHTLTKEQNGLDGDVLLDKLGYRPGDCSYMFTEDLSIQIHN